MHITNGSGTGDDGPAITNDLNPTVPKTVGDVLLEPAVIGVAVVVSAICRAKIIRFMLTKCHIHTDKKLMFGWTPTPIPFLRWRVAHKDT